MAKNGRIIVAIGLPVVVVLGVLSYFLLIPLLDVSDSPATTETVEVTTASAPAPSTANSGRTAAVYPADLLPGSNEARNIIADLPILLPASQLDEVNAAPNDTVTVTPHQGAIASEAARVFIDDAVPPETASFIVTAAGFQPDSLVPFGAVFVQPLPGSEDEGSPAQASSFHVRADADGAVAFVVDVSHLGLYQVTTAVREGADLAQFFVVTSADDDVVSRREWLDTLQSS